MAFSGSFTVLATTGWAQLSSMMTVSVNKCTWMFVLGIQILKGLTATVCSHCVIMILSPVAVVLSLSLHFCLDRFTTWCTVLMLCCTICNSYSPSQLWLHTSVCHCVYQVKCAAAPSTPPQLPHEQISVVHATHGETGQFS
jgi:hypothetical protein